MKMTFLLCGWLALGLPVMAQQKIEYFTGNKTVSHERLLDCLQKQKLAGVAGELSKQLAPGVRLTGAGNAMVVKATNSKFGGVPALPSGVEWPSWNGTNLIFLAQVNFKELQAATPRTELPATGLLLFFYDANQSTWGFDPKDKGSWRVIYTDGETALARWPAKLPAEARLKEAPMRFQAVQTLPVSPFKVTGYDELDEKSQERFDAIVHEYLERNKPMHQLLGNAVPIQGDNMQLECQLVSNGLYCGDGRGYNDPRAEKLGDGAKEWVLLAMIDTDEPRGWMWGDGGCLYFWIRQEDLKARRFENVWMILQCY